MRSRGGVKEGGVSHDAETEGMVAKTWGKICRGIEGDPNKAGKCDRGDAVSAVLHCREIWVTAGGGEMDEEEDGRGDEVLRSSESEAEVSKDGGGKQASAVEAGEFSDGKKEEPESCDERDTGEEVRPSEVFEKMEKGKGGDGEDEVVDSCTENAFGHRGDERDDDGNEDGGEWVGTDSGNEDD